MDVILFCIYFASDMKEIKKGDKIGDYYVSDKKVNNGSITLTMSAVAPEPDWKEIAYELASLLDDIDLHFQTKLDLLNKDGARFHEDSDTLFHIKKFLLAQKHFIRYKNQLLYIDDYNKKKESESRMREMMLNTLTK